MTLCTSSSLILFPPPLLTSTHIAIPPSSTGSAKYPISSTQTSPPTPTMTSTPYFNPSIGRSAPWWSTETARAQLLTHATPLQYLDDTSDDCTDPELGIYVYSKQVLTQRFNNLKALQSVDHIFYAQKANNNVEVVQHFHNLGAGIECVSLAELKSALQLFPMINGNRLLFTPNFASKREFQNLRKVFDTPERRNNPQITQLFPFITIDNQWVLETWPFEIFANFPLFLRLTPTTDGYGHHSHVSTGKTSKFGICQDDLVDFFKSDRGQQYAPLVRGLHMHKGSGVSTSEEWAKTATELLSHLQLFPNMTHLDVGGGLSIPYKPTDTPFDLSALDATLFTVKQRYPQITFCVEPGRYLVAESGVILTRINQLKSKGGFKFVGLGVGMNALIRPALYDSYHHIINLSKFHPQYLQMAAADLSADTNVHNDLHFSTAAPIEQPLVVNVVGPICESGDFLGKNRLFPQASNEDDIVLIDAAGAYGKVMSSNYNLRGNFREVLAEFE